MFISACTGFFWLTGILNTLLSMYPKLDEQQQQSSLINTVLIVTLFNTVLIIFLKIFESQIIRIAGNSIAPFYNHLLLFIFINNPAFITEYFLLLANRTKALIFYGVAVFITSVCVIALPLYSGNSLEVCLRGLILLSVLRLVAGLFLLSRKHLSPDYKLIRNQIIVALPLTASMFVSGSADYIDGFLVTSNFGADAFAIFRYGAREFPVTLLLANAMSTAMLPRLAGQIDQSSLQHLKDEGERLMHLLFIPTCILLFLSHWLYPLVFRPEFAASAEVFNIFLLLIISRLVFPQTVVMALQRTKVIFSTAIAEILVNVVGSIILMKYYGMAGIAAGTVIAFCAEKLILTFYLMKYEGIRPSQYTNLKMWFGYTLLIISVYCYVTF